MKLLIAVPCMDTIPTGFMRSLLGLQKRLISDGINHDIAIQSGTLVYMARNKLASKAINDGYDAVLWLDSDMIFNDAIYDDLSDSRKDFISGVYHMRRGTFASCVFKDIRLDHFTPWGDEYPRDVFEIAGCGFGCVLIKTDILADVMKTYGTAFDPMKQIGEDIAFCQRARDLGYKIFCDPFVRCGHIAHITVYPDDAPRYRPVLEGQI